MATTSSAIISQPSSPLAWYEISILSNFRNSLPYLRRYLDQIERLALALPQKRILLNWLEGDSTDGTDVALKQYADILNDSSRRVHVHLVKFDVGGQLWPEVNHPDRWAQIAKVWDTNCLHLPTVADYAICVEADLIWDHTKAIECLRHVRQGIADVIYPLLMYTPNQFYDTHATYRKGKPFSAWPPFVPDDTGFQGERFVEVDHAGGMIVMKGETLERGQWDPADCVLKFPADVKRVVDLACLIRHPPQVHR